MKNGILILTIFILSVFSASGTVAKAGSVPLGKWRLVSYDLGSGVEMSVTDKLTFINIKDAGRIGGNTGCNLFGGKYTFEDSKFEVGELFSTKMACEEPSPSFETDFLNVLDTATKFEIDGKTLNVIDAEGKRKLTFAAMPDNGASNRCGYNRGARGATAKCGFTTTEN